MPDMTQNLRGESPRTSTWSRKIEGHAVTFRPQYKGKNHEASVLTKKAQGVHSIQGTEETSHLSTLEAEISYGRDWGLMRNHIRRQHFDLTGVTTREISEYAKLSPGVLYWQNAS